MKTRALLLALPALALALGGCRDNRASISIHGVCAPPTSTCTFSGKCDAFYLGMATIDTNVSAAGELMLPIEVENQLQDNTNTQEFHTNSNDAHVDEVIVTYDGLALPQAVIGAQQLIPTGSTAVVAATIIPASAATLAALKTYATATGREMTATVKFGGYWDDGSRWETGEFPLPVVVCAGCVGSCANPGATCPPSVNGQLPIACF